MKKLTGYFLVSKILHSQLKIMARYVKSINEFLVCSIGNINLTLYLHKSIAQLTIKFFLYKNKYYPRQDLGKIRSELVDLFAMVDLYNNLLAQVS